MHLPDFWEALHRLPIVEWVSTAINTLRQLSLAFIFLSIAFLLVYLYPNGFSPEQRFALLKGIGLLVLVLFVIVAVLTALPGSPLYAPYERALERGKQYGTKDQPQKRRVALDKPRETEPSLEPSARPPQLPAGGLRDPTQILAELQRSPEWAHYMDSTWFIVTNETAVQLWNRIAPRFIQSDSIFIVQIHPGAAFQGWLPREAWDWFNQRRYR